MGRELRFIPYSRTTFEVTIRTQQSRYLLKPSKRLNELVVGILGRAQEKYGVEVHFVAVMSNHDHLIVTVSDSEQLAKFMCYVNGNMARAAGRLYGWRGKFWGRRYTAKAIMDEGALLERVRYVLSHGCKEGLVSRPGDWPGVNVVGAIIEGKKLVGKWVEGGVGGKWAEKQYELKLSRPPLWEDLSEGEYRGLIKGMVEEIELETGERLRREGKGVLGVKGVLALDPHEKPRESKRSRAPCCHASSEEKRREYRELYRAFLRKYRLGREQLRAGRVDAEFPQHCFPPALPYTGSLARARAPG